MRDNLPKVKDETYVINLDEYSDIGTHWIALYAQNNDLTYFDNFGIEHIPEEIKTFISNENIKINIFRIQAYNSIMCGYICIVFIDFMLAGKTLIDFKMADSHETPNMYQNFSATPLNVPLNSQQHFRLNKINEIKYYFVGEI